MPAIEQSSVTLRGELVAWSTRTADGWGTGSVRLPRPPATKKRAELAAPSDPLFDELLDDIDSKVPDFAPPTSGNVDVTGKLLGVRPGDTVELEGVWSQHPRYGWQLKVRKCTPMRPEGPDGAVKWMSSRFPDVGERRARELVQKFGAQLWSVIEHEPARLTEVAGITATRAQAISAAYRRVAGEREHMVLLRGWGLTDGQVARCIERWHDLDQVVAELRRNPYLLGQEVFGFGFLRADQVALKMGVPKGAPERIKAGVEHVLEEAAAAGHVYVAGAALQRMSAELLGVEAADVAPAIKAAAEAGRLIRRGWRIYTARMDRAEQLCAEGIRRLLGRDGKAAA